MSLVLCFVWCPRSLCVGPDTIKAHEIPLALHAEV